MLGVPQEISSKIKCKTNVRINVNFDSEMLVCLTEVLDRCYILVREYWIRKTNLLLLNSAKFFPSNVWLVPIMDSHWTPDAWSGDAATLEYPDVYCLSLKFESAFIQSE